MVFLFITGSKESRTAYILDETGSEEDTGDNTCRLFSLVVVDYIKRYKFDSDLQILGKLKTFHYSFHWQCAAIPFDMYVPIIPVHVYRHT